MTDPQPEQPEQPEPEQSAGPGDEHPGDASATESAPADTAENAPQDAARPTRPQPPAMTPAEIAQNPAALVRVPCDGRCGQACEIYAGDNLPTDPDGQPFENPTAVLMEAAGCLDDPAACPGAVGTTAERDTFDTVTGLGGLAGPGIGQVDLTQLVHRVRGRDPELQPVVADSGVAPVPLLTVDDLEQAANGEVRLPVAASPFDPPPVGMLAALGVDMNNLNPALAGLPPGKVTAESGGEAPPSGGDSA